MSTAEPQLLSTAALRELSLLEPVARDIFGDGQRPQGWFARKLHREVVSASASRLAVAPGFGAEDPAGWLGYGLLGLPPSLGSVARTAGIGLRPRARGHGWGALLLAALKAAALEHGRDTLEVPASVDSVGFYRQVGLRQHGQSGTWLAFGRGLHHADPDAAKRPALPWAMQPEGNLLAAWIAETWDRTPRSQRYRWVDHTQTLDVSIEGTAHLAHRWSTSQSESGAVQRLQRWLDALPNGTPALVSSVPRRETTSPLEQALQDAGWVCVQTSVTMRGSTRTG